MSTKPAYRPDIDGLRAIAVTGVVLYHYGATWLPGGFTGVDIFFVISGFLITRALITDIESGSFSLLGFYDRRLRRILPALLVMLATTLGAGWYLLMPGDYADLGQSAAMAAFGFGNFFFFGNTGYFDQAADLQPLLHTWSLGVEEQFYFLWPVALWIGLVLVKSRRWFMIFFCFALALGFAYSLRKVANEPAAAFYLPLPRAWELGVGAIVAFLPKIRNPTIGTIIGLFGLGMIGVSLFVINSSMPFPGHNALFACLGSAALLWPKPHDAPTQFLSARPAAFVGLVSYSLYLWHWPALVFYRHYLNGKFPDASQTVLLLALVFAVSWASWRFIERPFRKPISQPIKVVLSGLAVSAVVAIPAAYLVGPEGYPDRVPPAAEEISSLEVMWEWDCATQLFAPLDGDYCVFGSPLDEATSLGIVWGDSHAEHTSALIEPDAKSNGVAFALVRECPAALGGNVRREWVEVPGYVERCEASRKRVVAAIRSGRVSYLVLASSWNPLASVVSSPVLSGTGQELIASGLRELLEQVARPELRIVLVDQFPNFSSSPTSCALQEMLPLARSPVACGDFEKQGYELSAVRQPLHFPGFDDLASHFPNVVAVHPRDSMCRDGRCMTMLDGTPLFRDGNHLRRNLNEDTRSKLAHLVGISSALRGSARQ
jgi:peptidoglycan/LPS O-acetylase OafA/YrhL